MATQLDQQLEQLENLVERQMNRCEVRCNGSRCMLPRNHVSREPHKFLVDFLQMLGAAERFRACAEVSPRGNLGQASGNPGPRRRWGDSRA